MPAIGWWGSAADLQEAPICSRISAIRASWSSFDGDPNHFSLESEIAILEPLTVDAEDRRMAHPFEITLDTTVPATPEEVWDAVTSGPKIDSWFMGRNRVEPTQGGVSRTEYPGFTIESTVTAWQPPTRFQVRTPEDPDGGFHVFDYRIEAADPGARVRWNHSGALTGDDWEAEYTAMGEGDPMYFHKLAEYMTYFRGRVATPVDAFGPNQGPSLTAASFREALGLEAMPSVNDHVRLMPEGLDPIEGIVDHTSRSFLGVRTDDAMYRFIAAFEGTPVVGHHFFADVDHEEAVEAWTAWLARAFS